MYMVMCFRYLWILCLFFFLPFLPVFAAGKAEKANAPSDEKVLPAAQRTLALPEQISGPPASEGEARIFDAMPVQDLWSAASAAGSAPVQTDTTSSTEIRPAESRAETISRALAEAYPDRVGEIKFLDGDWTVEVYGETFYYAEGRMLPASLRNRMNEYDPQPFYNYPTELPPWKPPTEEESARMKEQTALRNKNPAKRSQHFCDALWRSRSRDESWEHVKQIRFLGYPVMVHYSILS